MRKIPINQQLIVFIIFVVLFVVFSTFLPGFLTTQNILNLVRSVSVLGILGLGMSIVVIGRGIDLSMVALLAVPSALVLQQLQVGHSLPYALLIGLGLGVLTALISGFLIAYAEVLARETGQTDIFAAGWTQRLMAVLFDSRDPGFGGTFFTLHIDDKLVAAQFHLRGADIIHAWIIAHDAAYERVSPGLLLFQDIMHWMDETPYTSIDYGPGDYRFKRQLANAECVIGHGFVGRPGAATFIRGAAYGIREAAERLSLGKVSELPGKAMRRYDLMRGLR